MKYDCIYIYIFVYILYLHDYKSTYQGLACLHTCPSYKSEALVLDHGTGCPCGIQWLVACRPNLASKIISTQLNQPHQESEYLPKYWFRTSFPSKSQISGKLVSFFEWAIPHVFLFLKFRNWLFFVLEPISDLEKKSGEHHLLSIGNPKWRKKGDKLPNYNW